MTKTITIDVEEESYNRGYDDGQEAKVASYKFAIWLGLMCGVVLTLLIKYYELLFS